MITIFKKDNQWFVCERKQVGPKTMKVTTVPINPTQAIQIKVLTGAQLEPSNSQSS